MGRGFQRCHVTRVCTVHSWGPRLVLADRDKEFSWKRLSGSLHQSARWLLVLCVPSMSVKHSDKTQSESLHNEDYWTCFDAHKKPPDTCVLCTFLHLSFLCDPLPGPCWTSLTSVITSPFPMRSARGGEGERRQKHLLQWRVYPRMDLWL